MARSTMAVVKTALDNIKNSLTSGNTQVRSPVANSGLDSLAELARALAYAFTPNITVTVTAVTLAVFMTTTTGGLSIAKGGVVEVGDVFVVTSAQDLTSTVLATAKGSAPAAGDRFEVTNVGSPAVVYLGAAASLDISTHYLARR